MRAELTERVHVSLMCWRVGGAAIGGHMGSHVQSFWPFRGFWLSVQLDLGRTIATLYIGE